MASSSTKSSGKSVRGSRKTPKKNTVEKVSGAASKTDTKPKGKVASKKDANKKSSTSGDNSPQKVSNRKQSGFISRLIRWVRNLVFILIAYPIVFTLIYKIPSIHPVSHLMIYEAIFGNGAKREWLDLENISPNLRRSVIMSEDGKFCSHNGVDWDALNTVVQNAMEGEPTRGASTITMQLAKNMFLWNSRSYLRKGLEIPLAMWLDFVLGKRRVMEIYLNIAEWDKGKFGVELGSQSYFKRSAGDLTRKQAALLAVTLPNPAKRNAAKPSGSMSRVGRIVERRARNGKFYVKCIFDKKS